MARSPFRKKWLTVAETAWMLGRSQSCIYRIVSRSLIPHIRLGTRIYIPKDYVDQVVNGEIEISY